MVRIVIDPMPDGSVVLAFHGDRNPDSEPEYVLEFQGAPWRSFASAVISATVAVNELGR